MCERIDYCNWILRSFGRSHITKQCACPTPGTIILPPFSRLRVDRRKRFEYATCGREFFQNGEKNLRSQKSSHTCGQGLGIHIYQPLFLENNFTSCKNLESSDCQLHSKT